MFRDVKEGGEIGLLEFRKNKFVEVDNCRKAIGESKNTLYYI